MEFKRIKNVIIPVFFFALVIVVGCKKENDRGDFNIFAVQDDIDLGREITDEILSNPEEYPILDESLYPEAYEYLRSMRDEVLSKGGIRFADRFDWNIYIIDQDVLNAFALPGGNTFYYTGLIKFLDNEASLMGVMAHEFAHCDRRHSTARLTKVYGIQVVLSILLGENPSMAAEIAANLALGLSALQFSRDDEYEADFYAVKYVYPTETDSRGVAYFFEKMELEEGKDWMIYFSTHPHPNDRIEKIYQHWNDFGAKDGDVYDERYEAFKNSLP